MTPRPHLGGAAWLKHGEVARLLALLDRDGEEARVVGGAVRNALLRLPVDEIDVATTAVPAEVMRRVAAAGCKAIPTGIEHGTVTVVIDHQPVEVTTLREDVETFGRKARVAFGRDWRADAERRDFTINALSASADGTVYDYVGGVDDIAARRVRFIGEPQRRIEEDFLRILRFFRFHAYFGEGTPNPVGLRACIRARAGLETLSRERVRMELLKLFVASRATPTLAVMAESGLLGMVLGGVAFIASFENMVKVEAALGATPDSVRRLGAIGVWVAEDAERLSQRLRLSNAESERLLALEQWWRIAPQADQQAARVILYRLGPQTFADQVMLAWARSDAGAADHHWRELANLPQRWTAPAFPLKAADFMERGVPAGPSLGAALRAAEAAWIAADFPAERVALEAIADGAAKSRHPGAQRAQSPAGSRSKFVKPGPN
ncbi:MAG TPA: CCA tRNA nucleotidyltransferase [Xanthobacteraceae bacterium]|nr:CCA tRNA nucleotidyltransferase [Xanthobacteraceae bacterium]